MRRKIWATLALCLAAAGVTAAPAGAVTVTVTGDDGNPVVMAPGTPTVIRNMNVTVGVALAAPEREYGITVNGPVGAATTARSCYGSTRNIDFQGNGTYTVTVTTYSDLGCTTGARTATYAFTINSSTAVTPPGGAVLTRKPNDYVTQTYQVPVALNPGASSTSLHYAAGATLGPDGGIAGPSTEAFVNTQTGTAPVSFQNPGTYTMVARAKGLGGAAGQFFSPWSAPVQVRVFAPFDFQGTPTFPDSRGPSYKLRGIVREAAARGSKVRISLARGSRGGRFRSIGSAKIRKGGKITKRFRLGSSGKYRLKYRFKGNRKVLPGTYVQKFTITRRFI
jgi:hypothetical protein